MTTLSETVGAAAARRVQGRALSRTLELPVLGGNRVELLDGGAARAALCTALDQARDHINIQTSAWPGGANGERWMARLLARARVGVRVNLMFDGSLRDPSLPQMLLQRLRRGGVRVCEARVGHPAWTWLQGAVRMFEPARDLVVLDGRAAFIGPLAAPGSASLDDGLARSYLLRVEGPAVAELQWQFIDAWRQRDSLGLPVGHYFPALAWVGSQRVGFALSGRDDEGAAYERTLLAAVDAARDRVLLLAARGLPDLALQRALVAACKRGVDVHVLWLGGRHRWLQPSLRAGCAPLLGAGARVHELTQAATACASVIDGVWTSIEAASAAAHAGSQRDHLIVLDAEFGAPAEAAFWRDVARSHAVTPDASPPSPLTRLNLLMARYLEVRT